MEINAVSPQNFKSQYIFSDDFDTNDAIDAEYIELTPEAEDTFESSTTEAINNKEQEKKRFFTDKYRKAVEKARQDVHPATIFASVGLMLAAALKGKKVVSYVRKGVVTLGEYGAKAAINVTGSVLNKLKKPDTASKVLAKKDKITKGAEVLRDKNCAKNEKMLDGIKNAVAKLTDEKKGESIKNFLTKNNITNPVRLFDAAIASLVGISAVDKTSDVVENALDNYDIKKTKTTATEAVKDLIIELAED